MDKSLEGLVVATNMGYLVGELKMICENISR